MRRFILLSVLIGTSCGGTQMAPDVSESRTVSHGPIEDELVISEICRGTEYEEGARERIKRFLASKGKPSEEERVEIHRQIACVAIVAVPEVVAMVEESEIAGEHEVLRRSWLAYDVMDYAGRVLPLDSFVTAGSVASPHLNKLYESDLITVSRGSYLEAPGNALLETIADADAVDDLLIDLQRCSAGEIQNRAEEALARGESPSREFCGRDGVDGGDGGEDGESGGGSVPGATPEGGNRMGDCLIEAASKLRGDMAICIGTPSFGGNGDLGVGTGEFCTLAAGQSTLMKPKVEWKVKVSNTDGKTKWEASGKVKIPFGPKGESDSNDTQRRQDAQAEADRLVKEAFDKGKEIGDLKKQAREKETTATSESPVVTQEAKAQAKKDLEALREKIKEAEEEQDDLNKRANDKQREADGHETEDNEEGDGEPSSTGEQTMCEPEMETCGGRCSAGQGGATTVGGITIGANTSCAAGRVPFDRNDGAMDPPRASDEQMGSLFSCLGLGEQGFAGSLDNECTKMLCANGRTSSMSSNGCSCGGVEGMPVDPNDVAANRCKSLIQCEPGAPNCSCEGPVGGTLPLRFGENFSWTGVATLFSAEGCAIAVPIDLNHPPVAIQEDVESPGERPLGMMNNIGITDGM